MKKLLSPDPIYTLLTVIWLVLIGLCGIIALLVVPLDPLAPLEYRIVISALKVVATGILGFIWLTTWYKLLQIVLVYQLNSDETGRALSSRD